MMSCVWYNENVRNDYGVEEEERSILWTLWILLTFSIFFLSCAEFLGMGGSGRLGISYWWFWLYSNILDDVGST